MTEAPTRTPIVQELVDYLSQNPAVNAAFQQSFTEARGFKLKLWEDFQVDSVEDYLGHMDKFVYWVPSENCQGKNVYDHICLFYFILDLPPIRLYQSLIHPSSHSPWTWLSEWLIKYAKEMGQWMYSTSSLGPIESFAASPAYRDKVAGDFYDQYPPPLAGWKTFNEFFARHINAKYRPIADPDDNAVIVCPADCAFGGKWQISGDSTVEFDEQGTPVEAKGVPWSIKQLLDDDSNDYHTRFCGGVFTHAFLNTTNYHRLHAPVSGRVIEAKVIPGLCYLQVKVVYKKSNEDNIAKPSLRMLRRMKPEAVPFGHELTAPNSAGYQFLQARALVLIQSPIGLVAVLPIGMAQVSSVVLTVKKGDDVKKGHEIGFFQLGGSDVVMVFEKDAKVNLDEWKAPQEDEGEGECGDGCDSEETFTKVGSKIGTAELVTVAAGHQE